MKKICALVLSGVLTLSLIGCSKGTESSSSLSTVPIPTAETMVESAVETTGETVDAAITETDSLPVFFEVERPERTTDISIGEIMSRVYAQLDSCDSFAIVESLTLYEGEAILAEAFSRMEFDNTTGEMHSYSESTYEHDIIQQNTYVVKQPYDKFDYVTYSEYTTIDGDETFTELTGSCGRTPFVYFPIYEMLSMESYMDVYQDNYEMNGEPHFVLKNFIPIAGLDDSSVCMYINANDYTITRVEQDDKRTGSVSSIAVEYNTVDITLPEEFNNVDIQNDFGGDMSADEFALIKQNFDTFTSFFALTDCEPLAPKDVVLSFGENPIAIGDKAKDVLSMQAEDYYLSQGSVYDAYTCIYSPLTDDTMVRSGDFIRYDVIATGDESSDSAFWLYNPKKEPCSVSECIVGAIKFDRYYENDVELSVSMATLFDMKAMFGDNYQKTFRSDDVSVCHWDLGRVDIFAEDLGFMFNSIVVKDDNCPSNIDMFSAD